MEPSRVISLVGIGLNLLHVFIFGISWGLSFQVLPPVGFELGAQPKLVVDSCNSRDLRYDDDGCMSPHSTIMVDKSTVM